MLRDHDQNSMGTLVEGPAQSEVSEEAHWVGVVESDVVYGVAPLLSVAS